MQTEPFLCAECGDPALENEKERRCITCPKYIEQTCLPEAEVRIADNKRRYRCKTCRLDELTMEHMQAVTKYLLERQNTQEFKTAQEVRAHLREQKVLPPFVPTAELVTPQALQFEYTSDEESEYNPDASSSSSEDDEEADKAAAEEEEPTRRSARKRPAEALEEESDAKRSRTSAQA